MTGETTLLALDFDGTIAPIHDDPAQVRMNRGAGVLISEALQMEGVVVAIVSGRDADDLAEKIGEEGAYLVASHGLEIRGPGGVVIRDTPPIAAALPREIRTEAEASGLRIEEKKHAIALHWRGVPYAAIAPLADQFRGWAESNELDIIEGRCVVEARCRGGDKKRALEWLVSALGISRVVYAGDDLTDFAPLRYAAGRGRGVFVASSERDAPPGVTVVSSFRELFRLLREEVMI